MPVRRFWLMTGNINRILATEDMRSLSVYSAAQGQEAAEEKRKQLILEIGDVTEVEEKLDKEGLSDLRRMSKQVVAV